MQEWGILMALYELQNGKISIQADSLGAELKSLKRTDTGTEYMWEGNPEYWKRTSPVLFPLVGSLHHGSYLLDGTRYPMGQHGFARDMEFELKSQSEREIWFCLKSSQETLEKYPYEFLLEIGYKLQRLAGCRGKSDGRRDKRRADEQGAERISAAGRLPARHRASV